MSLVSTLKKLVHPSHAPRVDAPKPTRTNPNPSPNAPRAVDRFTGVGPAAFSATSPLPEQWPAQKQPQPAHLTENAERVTRELYKSLLGREPDADGAKGWTELIQRGGLAEAVSGIMRSSEFKEQNHTPESLTKALYNVMLQREPDESGKASTEGALAQGIGAFRVLDILKSPEYLEVLQRAPVATPGPTDPTDPTTPVTADKRTGAVRVDGKSFSDANGKFVGVGATMMWAAWAYKNDRAKLEEQLSTLSKNGFNYIRALGVVGDVNNPDYWDGREIDWKDPQYKETIAGLTDLAYDKYGLRIEWTLIGDGQKNIPNESDRFKLADTFLEMSKGREEKIMHFEVANEAWQNGFDGDQGVDQLRRLTKYMNDRTDIPVAASAPDGHDEASVEKLYKDGVADLATIHFDRDTTKTEGSWRPVRQPWEYQYVQNAPRMASNNEPIGPGSSVASENDPKRLVAGALASYVSGVGSYVYHTRGGVRGDENISNMAGIDAFKNMSKYVPGDLSSWSPKNAHWADAPFRAFVKMPNGELKPDQMWPDEAGAQGAVRVYSAVKGNEFFSFPFGIKGELNLEPRRPVQFDVINPMTGEVISQRTVQAGERFTLSGDDMFVLKGRYL